MIKFLLAAAIFIINLILIIVKPYNKSEAFYTIISASAALLLGLVGLNDAVFVVGNIWNAVFSLISIMLISSILDEIGFFRWAALTFVYSAEGSTRRLFVFIIFLGALISIFFNNDGTILILTPIVLEMVGALGFEKKKMIPFLFACGFIADTASVPLIVSNLANIVNADTLGISFNYYFSKMALPGIIAIVTVTITLVIYFKDELRFEYNTGNIINPDEAVSDWGMFNMGFLVLIVVVLGYFIGSKYGIPVSFIAFSGALVLMIYNRKNKTIDIKKVIGSAPWGIITFAFGMYLIVYGLYVNGFNAIMSDVFAFLSQTGRLSSVFISGMVSTATACTMNNLPAVMIGAFSVKDANLGYAAREAASLSNVIGSDIGAKLTPIGSLATILWMNIFKSKGINVSWRDYTKSAFFIISPVLILTLLVLGITI